VWPDPLFGAALGADDQSDTDLGGSAMSEFIERQRPVIERSGMGLLPGISVAFALAMGMIAAVALADWWVIAVVLAGIFTVTVVVIAVIVGLLGSEDDIYSADG